ncbi:discoidin domain-containing protein [Cohnella sp.]|uniref:discoidin domain-containing protein n=1 Tax=Cohnella sp. TaxID=1883426 RepID=UPI0035685B00
MDKLKKSLLLVTIMCMCFAVTPSMAAPPSKNNGSPVQVWLTNPGVNKWLSKEGDVYFSTKQSTNPLTIKVDHNVKYQQMDGYGAAMTDSSAWLIWNKLTTANRYTLMKNLFDPTTGIGMSLIRNPMGATDVTVGGNYSYDDMSAGQTDPTLANFSIQHDVPYIIPALQQALSLNPSIKIMANTWSPPGWMKTSDNMIGGTLKDEYYTVLANYFAKFIQAYSTYGVPITYVSPQNEPMGAPPWPGMFLHNHQQIKLIGEMGKAFAANNISSKILVWDHNWDVPSLPETIFNDPTASQYAFGTGWHIYSGTPVHQTLVHNDYPSKKAFITEATGGTWQSSKSVGFHDALNTWIINGTRNWANGVMLWNIALDENMGPLNSDTDGIPMMRGLVTINQSTGAVTYNEDYYAVGHASKFVKPGAYRIYSNSFGKGSIENVAFQNPDGSKVLIVYNSGTTSQTFTVADGTEAFDYSLGQNAGVTFTWSGPTQNGSTPAAGNVKDPTHDFTFQTTYGPVTMTYDPAILPFQNAIRTGNSSLTHSLPIGASIQTGGTALSRTGWTVTASSSAAGDDPMRTIDGDLSTRWSNGSGMKNGDYIQLNLGSSQSFNQITVDTGPNSSYDYVMKYQVYVSSDGVNWGSALATGSGHIGKMTITLPTTQTAQYVRFVNTGTGGFWWSIGEINVYSASGTGSIAAPTEVSNGLALQKWTSNDGKEVTVVYNGTTTSQSFPVGAYTYALPSGTSAMFTTASLSGLPTPVFSSMTPTSGIPGYTATISGSGFGNTQGFGTVLFGSIHANITSWSDTTINLKVPHGLPSGTIPVSVFGTSGVYAGATSFTVTGLGTALSRTGWIATASHTSPWGDVPANMLDGNVSSRWSSGAGQSRGMWIQVDMGSAQTFNKIVLDSSGSNGDQLRKGDVHVSSDGINWTKAATISDNGQLVQLATFSARTARYIKVTSTGTVGNWWSVHELNVYTD